MLVAEELQELLLAREEELTRKEEALAMREEKVRILEKALAKVSADLNAKWAKAEATQKEYLSKMEADTTCQALTQPWHDARREEGRAR
jgi:hypothetical protein